MITKEKVLWVDTSIFTLQRRFVALEADRQANAPLPPLANF